MTTHKDKDGNLTPICELETSHLKNIIRMHNRRAQEGVKIKRIAGSGWGSEGDFWYYDDYLKGKEALEYLHTAEYVAELNSRQT